MMHLEIILIASNMLKEAIEENLVNSPNQAKSLFGFVGQGRFSASPKIDCDPGN